MLLNSACVWSPPWQTCISHLCQVFTFCMRLNLKIKGGSSVAFLFLESFTFRFSPLIPFPWKSMTSVRFLLRFKGKDGRVCSTGDPAEFLARSKKRREEKKKKDPHQYFKYFIKSSVPFSLYSSTKTWGEDMAPWTCQSESTSRMPGPWAAAGQLRRLIQGQGLRPMPIATMSRLGTLPGLGHKKGTLPKLVSRRGLAHDGFDP